MSEDFLIIYYPFLILLSFWQQWYQEAVGFRG